jgi:hypothetical protein
VQKSVLAKERTGELKNPLISTTAQRRTTADRVDKIFGTILVQTNARYLTGLGYVLFL